AETEENNTEVRDFNSQADDYDLASNGRHVVLTVHGEIFTTPVEEGDLRQITDSPSRERNVRYSPDGKLIAFVSDMSGREEIYVTNADGSGKPRQLSDLDTLKLEYNFSPDSSQIAYVTSDFRLRKVNVATKETVVLDTSRYGAIGTPSWSPD